MAGGQFPQTPLTPPSTKQKEKPLPQGPHGLYIQWFSAVLWLRGPWGKGGGPIDPLGQWQCPGSGGSPAGPPTVPFVFHQHNHCPIRIPPHHTPSQKRKPGSSLRPPTHALRMGPCPKGALADSSAGAGAAPRTLPSVSLRRGRSSKVLTTGSKCFRATGERGGALSPSPRP